MYQGQAIRTLLPTENHSGNFPPTSILPPAAIAQVDAWIMNSD
jgi:hypothetical protein